MTAEANPPSPAYAFGYVRNARAQSGKHTRPPARRTVPPGHQQQPQYPRPTRPAPAPPATRAKAGAVAAEHDDNLMESVDYRFHDPPSRPYVPWLEGYTMQGRGAQRATTSPDITTTTGFSDGRLAGSAGASNYARSKKKKRTGTRTTVDVMNNNRLDIVLSALRRACGLSAKEASHRECSHDRR
jgi:hypothetical protein